MKKKVSEYERFMALSDAEKDAEVAKYDREIDERELRPMTAEMKALWHKSRRRGRPRIGRGAAKIRISVERGLLERADAYAAKRAMNRSQTIAVALQKLIRGAA